ncbi:hypothetical protein GGI06_001638 [Coemansia sp. S85]|nr:hypothetical protein GGI06_001638 [Coemansia sp. S85]
MSNNAWGRNYNWGLDENDENVCTHIFADKEVAHEKIVDHIEANIGETDYGSISDLLATLKPKKTHYFKVRGYLVVINFIERTEKVEDGDIDNDGKYFKYSYKVIGENDGIEYTSNITAEEFMDIKIPACLIHQE